MIGKVINHKKAKVKSVKSVKLDLNTTKIHIIHDKRHPSDRHHHRVPILPNKMNIIDNYLHQSFIKKMRKKNHKIRKEFSES